MCATFGDAAASLAVGDIEREMLRLAARGVDLLGGRARSRVIDVEHGHPCALAGKPERNRAPDAGAGAGDDGEVIVQKHGVFVPV